MQAQHLDIQDSKPWPKVMILEARSVSSVHKVLSDTVIPLGGKVLEGNQPRVSRQEGGDTPAVL